MPIILKNPQNIDATQDPGLEPINRTPDTYVVEGTSVTENSPSANIVNNIYITRNGPGGRSGELQFNEDGAYIGDSGLLYDPNTDTLTTGTINITQLNANNANLGSVNNLTILGGNNNNVLKTNGSGVVTWASAFPSDGSNSGKFLMTNGISQVWSNVSYANLVDIPSNIATQSYVGNAITNLIDSSPAAMNTLNELATALGNNANYATDITNILANKANVSYVDNVTANITWANLSGKPTIPAEQINSDWTEINTAAKSFIQNKPTLGNISNINISGSSTQVLYGNGVFEYLPAGTGIVLTDISVGTPNSVSGGGNLSYANTTGVFTYTPPDLSGYVTGTPWTSEGYLTTITNIFDQNLNTTNNVTFNSVITSNVHAVSGAPAIGAPTNAVGGAGSLLTISAGDGGIATTGINAGNGGNLTITAGDAGSDIGNPSWGNIGGTLVLRGGNSSRPYHGSDVQIHSGDSLTSPGLISLHTGTNQWTFGKTGDLTLANNATIIAPADNDLTLVVTVEYNICTLLTGGSGYGGGGSSSAISGGSGTGMMVGYGYGLSGQVVNVSVTTPGTGYVDGDVLTMTAGSGATFVITRYNSAANPNTNTAPADWTFGTDGNLTLPLGGDIVDSTGNSVLGGQTFDQTLNTSNNVSFSSVTTGNIFNTGNIEITTPYGTVADIDISTDWAGNGSSGGIDLWLKHSDGLYIKTRDGNNIWSFDDNGTLNFPTTSNVTAAAISIDNANAKISMGTDTGNISISPGSNNWTFGTDGNLVLPGNTFAVNYANGTQVSIPTVGNIATLNLDGSNSNVLYGNGVFAAVAGGANTGNVTFNDISIIGTSNLKLQPNSANANAYLDIYLTAGPDIHIAGNGESVILGTDEFANVTVNVDGNVSIQANAGTPYTWNFGTDGNLTLPANTFAVNYANGTQVSIGGGGNTGNVTFSDQVVVGTGSNDGGGGLYLAPGNASIANSAVQYLRVRGGDVATHIHLDTGNNAYYDQYFGADSRFVKLEATGNVVINADDYAGNGATWILDTTGNLTLPSGGDILVDNGKIISADGEDFKIIVQDSNDDGNRLDLVVTDGTDQATRVEVDRDGMQIHTNLLDVGNSHYWAFNSDGNLNLPGNLVIAGNTSVFGTDAALIQTTDNRPLLALSSGANGAVSSLWVEDIGNVGTSNIAAVYANPTSGSKIVRIAVGQNGNTGPNLWDFGTTGILTLPQGSQISETANTSVNITTNANTWAFGVDGNLTLPGNTFAVNYANGTQVTLGGTYGNSNVATFLASYGSNTMTTTGNVSVGNIIGNGQALTSIAGGNVTGTVANATFATTAGTANSVAGANVSGTVSAATTAGTVTTADQPNITSVGTLTSLSVTGNITAGNINGGNLITANYSSAVLITAAQPNITSTGTLTSLSVTGNANVTGTLNVTGNITGNTNGFAIGYLNIPQIAASNATLGLTDAGKHYYSTSTGNFTLTIPSNASVAFATGTAISIVVQSAGNVLVNAASGVTLYMAGNSTAANRVASTYAMATLMKVASDTWMINGTGVS